MLDEFGREIYLDLPELKHGECQTLPVKITKMPTAEERRKETEELKIKEETEAKAAADSKVATEVTVE